MSVAPLALALVAVAGAQAAPQFSHRLHTQLMGCRDCHRAADNLLPPPRVCAPCHKQKFVFARRKTLVSQFSHARHLALPDPVSAVAKAIESGQYLAPAAAKRAELHAANVCTACHRGLAEPGAPGRAPLARMADCLVCHNRIEPVESCAKCHAAGVALKPASHTPDFLDTHTSGKLPLDKTTCAVCHGRRFTCLGCH